MRFLRDISKDIDLREIAEKYKLPLDDVKETVERSIVGICEKRHQTPKERGRYRMGDYYSFYISSVTSFVKDRVPEVKVFLSRTSKSLSEGLLKKELAEKLIDIRVKCLRRTAGVYSLIEAKDRIPAECIKAVFDELKERIKVRVIQKK